MTDVAEIQLSSELFLNKSTILYGVTKSGKSKVIRNILRVLNPDISQVIVICPSDPATGEYSADGLIASPCIHYTFDLELLKEIFNRNEMMASCYNKANNIKLLYEIIQKTGIVNSIQPFINKMEQIRYSSIQSVMDRYSCDFGKRSSEIKKINDEFDKTTRKLYKTFIRKHKKSIDINSLSQDCQYCIKYLDFNPGMVMIWDDCGSILSSIQKKDRQIVNDYFIRNRHAMITTIVAVQGDKSVHKDLRGNAFNSIFTDPITAKSFFDYRENQIDSVLRKRAHECIDLHFHDYQKLLYVREDREFYRFTAQVFTGLKIGSPSLLDFCERIKSKQNSIDKSNKYYHFFGLDH